MNVYIASDFHLKFVENTEDTKRRKKVITVLLRRKKLQLTGPRFGAAMQMVLLLVRTYRMNGMVRRV